ncbi:uncharacterized protein LOC124674474 [Lolium rigidum]|uniref:uncharacterized protein LOC124674474 n=1 Tax=Lolium rigidum TaxID=89674 RepID=UPI001F5D7456|nr:uncharacterized protein LOC124674474 [Lolium rigidum]
MPTYQQGSPWWQPQWVRKVSLAVEMAFAHAMAAGRALEPCGALAPKMSILAAARRGDLIASSHRVLTGAFNRKKLKNGRLQISAKWGSCRGTLMKGDNRPAEK